jgi:hypothetical protein
MVWLGWRSRFQNLNDRGFDASGRTRWGLFVQRKK